MPDHSTTLPHRARTRLAGAAGAITAAVAVWLVARYGADMHLRTPGFGSSQRPASLRPGFAAVVAVAASLLAWAALALVERARPPAPPSLDHHRHRCPGGVAVGAAVGPWPD